MEYILFLNLTKYFSLSENQKSNKLENILDFSYPYEKLSITFNAQLGFTDVWDDIDFYKERRIRIHPTQKPLELINRLVLASSNKNDLVLDPFMGSATTAMSCLQNGRNYLGFEMDTEYYQKSLLRIKEYTDIKNNTFELN